MTIAILLVIAQAVAPPDIINGGAAWVGTGLLGSVLAWIFFVHIPAKDKQLAEKDKQIVGLIDSRDALVRQLADSNHAAVKAMAADFRAAVADLEKRASEMDREKRHDFNNQLQMLVLHHKEEQTFTSQAIRRDLDELNGVMGDLRNMINEVRDKIIQPGPRPTRPVRPGQPPTAPPMPPPAGR